MTTKQPAHHFLLTVVAIALLVYLLIAVEQLRTTRCPPVPPLSPGDPRTILSAPAEKANSAPSHPPVSAPAPALPSASDARRKRPMPPCAAPAAGPAKSFLMVFMGHSGSTALLSELRGHSRVLIDRSEPVDHQPEFNTTAALQFTRDFFAAGIAQGKTPGFKIRPTHILEQPNNWRALAAEFDTRIIWQYRKNLLKSSVGEYSNRYLNDSSIVEGLRSKEMAEDRCNFGVGCSFRIDNFDFLHETLRGKLRSQKMITDAVHAISDERGCVRELPYEDYLYDREDTLEDIQRFLGLPLEKTEPERFKATGDNMCEVVENWQELCDNFYGCLIWQHMLDDPRNNCFCSFSSGPIKYCDM